jgi:hypothetical protein
MHKIPLEDGSFALIDADLADAAAKLRWRIVLLNGKRYVGTYMYGGVFLLHRWVMGLERRDPRMLDHRDRDTLNNQRCNLRFATRSQNMCNRGQQSHSRQPYKGVERLRSGRYRARITLDGKRIGLPGTFDTPEEAFEQYKKAALELHGEFASF